MTRICFFSTLLLFLATRLCIAQSPETIAKIDSLQKITTSNAHDTIKVQAMVDWDNLIYQSDPDLDKELNERIKTLCKKKYIPNNKSKANLFFAKNLAFAHDNLGTIARHSGDSSVALREHKKGLSLRKEIGDQKGIALSYNNIAIVYMLAGDYKKAIAFFNKSLKIREKINDRKGAADCLSNIGALYIEQADYKKAKEYYSKSAKSYFDLKDATGEATSLQNLGVIAIEELDWNKAIDYTQRYFDYTQSVNNKYGMSMAYNNFGKIYAKKEEFEKALSFYEKSLAIKEEIGDKKGVVICLNNIGNIYLDQKKYAKALALHKRSFGLAKQMNLLHETRNAANMCYIAYKALGQKAQALDMFEEYIAARDSMMNKENTKVLLEQEYTYKYEKQTLADSIKYEENKKLDKIKHDNELEKEKNFRYILYSGLLFVLVIGLILLRGYRIKRRDNQIIAKQKQEVELQRNIAEQKNHEILDSINYAKRIQTAILPPKKQIKEAFPHSFILYKPKDIVAGDFYWLEKKAGITLFAVCDCTGHGVPGAMVSVICNNGLNQSVREYGLTDPGKILDTTRELVLHEFEKSEEEVKDGMDIALCAFNLSGNKKTVQYAGANNHFWLFRKTNAPSNTPRFELIEFKADKQPIGQYANAKPFTTHAIEVQEGDLIYLFTDGFQDQFGGDKGKKFKASNLKDLLLNVVDKSLEEQAQLIDQTFEDWKGHLEQNDDVCLVGIQV